jgi:hypothetical protein
MTLAREADNVGHLGDRELRLAEQLARSMDAPLDHKPARRQARARLESRREMIRAEAADRRQLCEAELVPEMRVDVLEHAPQPVQRKAAAPMVGCSRAVAVFAQQMDGERGTDRGSDAPRMQSRSLLVDWANEQRAWVRQLVSEVILAGKTMIVSWMLYNRCSSKKRSVHWTFPCPGCPGTCRSS